MAFDETLAERVRHVLRHRLDVEERRMFGGLTFMVGGHMSCGILESSLMVRVDPESSERLLRGRHVRPMDFTGRPMRGFLFVDAPGIKTAALLAKWVERGVALAESKPAKSRAARIGRRAVSPQRARRPRPPRSRP